jgi:NADH-quinone oxidoreductase subunit G
MAIVIVDGQEIEIGDQERLNGIQVARRAGVEIPHYCWHPGLTVVASCRMCLVETGALNKETGAVTMMPKLVPACQTPAKDGTVFVTNSDNVKRARAMVEEDLLIDHPIDCPICDKAGECNLQDYHFEHGQEERRTDIRPFTSRRREMGDTVTLFVDRCVMCTRCVRFTREISGASELMVINRGSHEEIDVFPGYPLDNKLSGNVVDLCPVGALGDKDFLYEQRVWFMKRHPGVCTNCATGCSIFVEENQDRVYRLKPRENPNVNQWWMCDEGRYGFHHVHSQDRQIGVRKREGDRYAELDWTDAIARLPEELAAASGLAVVLSPHLTVEEAYLLAKWARQTNSNATIALGPVPVEGQDETFKNGFTIRAEKCPNRRGVEEVVKHFSGRLLHFDDLLPRVERGEFEAVWISGRYKAPWNDDATAARFGKVHTLIVQDLFETPLWRRATWQLSGASFAEVEGSYVNHADLLQSAQWAIRPPAGVRVEGSLYWQLLGMSGLYKARTVLDELSCTIPYFAGAADPIPPTGADMKANLLAGSVP